jgi:DNA-binding XRE family transcriptional regulator
MQAVVKTPHIDIKIKGNISGKLLSVLKEEYGKEVHIDKEDENELVNIFQTEWYKKTRAKTTPGDNMKIYRELHKLTQAGLGEKIGGLPRQHISNMENGKRSISLNTAKKLSKLFKVSIEKFI